MKFTQQAMSAEADKAYMKELDIKTCPKCGLTGNIAKLFGYRKQGLRQTAQSYCFPCRGKKKKKITFNVIVIPPQKEAMRSLYKQHFPNDTNGDKRAWKFMAQKVSRKIEREGNRWICVSTI